MIIYQALAVCNTFYVNLVAIFTTLCGKLRKAKLLVTLLVALVAVWLVNDSH